MNYRIVLYILGTIMKLEGLLMALPLLTGLVYGERSWLHFGAPILVLFAAGLLLSRKKPENQAFFAKEGFVVVALSWIVLSLAGAVPFWISGEMGGFVDCFFESVSGFTTTGASVLPDVEAVSKGLLMWRSFMHWIGGMGVLVFVLAVLPMAGKYSIHLMRAESPGPSVGKLVPKLKNTATILYGIYIALTALLIILLMLGGMSLYDALIHAFGTAGTGGYSNYADSVGAFASGYIDVVITVFMLLFSFNFTLFYLILGKRILEIFKDEELRWFLAIVTGSIALIAIDILPLYEGLGPAVRDAAFQVASIISTTGFAVTNFDLWPMFSRMLLLMLMVIGACAGSTGGGIKVSRLVITAKNTGQEIKRLTHPRAVTMVKLNGKPVDEPVVAGVHAYLACYVGVAAVSLLLFSLEGFSSDATISGVLTCLNNVGPGLGVLGPMSNFSMVSWWGKLLLSADMLFGRLEIFPMLMLFSPRTWIRGR